MMPPPFRSWVIDKEEAWMLAYLLIGTHAGIIPIALLEHPDILAKETEETHAGCRGRFAEFPYRLIHYPSFLARSVAMRCFPISSREHQPLWNKLHHAFYYYAQSLLCKWVPADSLELLAMQAKLLKKVGLLDDEGNIRDNK